MATVIKQLKARHQQKQNYIIGGKIKVQQQIVDELNSNSITTHRKFKLLQQAITQNPYKAKYHKQYAFMLQEHYSKIKNNKFIDAENKKQLDLQAQKHYSIYKTITMVDKAFYENKLNRKSILYFNTLRNYLDQYEIQADGNFFTFHNYKIDDQLHNYSKNSDYTSRQDLIFLNRPGKDAIKGKWGGIKSLHGTSLRPTKLVKSPRAGALIPFLIAFALQFLSPKESTAAENAKIILVDELNKTNPTDLTGRENPNTDLTNPNTDISSSSFVTRMQRQTSSHKAFAMPSNTTQNILKHRITNAKTDNIRITNADELTRFATSFAYMFIMLFLLLPFMGALARGSPVINGFGTYINSLGTYIGSLGASLRRTETLGAYITNQTGFKNLLGLKAYKTLLGFAILLASLGLNAQTMTEADFGIERITDGQSLDSAKVTITMIENPSITQTKYTNGFQLHFNNVDLGPTSVKPQPQNTKPLTEVIGSGRDHTFNYETKNPEKAIIYDITGKAITTLNPEWNGKDIASAYWDGTLPNGAQAPNGIYIFSNGKNFSKKFVQINEGKTIGYKGINNEFEQKVEEKNKKIMEKSANAITKQYAVLIEPASSNPLMQFKTFRDTVTMQEDPNANQFLEQVEGVPQTQDILFHLARTYNLNDVIEGATFNIKEKTNGTIIGTGTSDANGNAWIENLPVGNDYDTVYVEFGGLPAYWSKKNCPLIRPTKIVFQEDTINYDTIYTTLADTGLLVPRRPLDPSPETVTPTQLRPARYGHWESINSVLNHVDRQIEVRIRGPPENILIEEAMGRPILFYTNFTGNDKLLFNELMDKADSLFFGEEPSPWQEVSTEFDEVWENNIDDYDYKNNYYPGQIGINILNGNTYNNGDATYTTGSVLYNSGEQLPTLLTWKGHFYVTLGEEAFYKERDGRTRHAGEVETTANGGEPSYMNPDASMPSLVDRAVSKVKRIEDKNKYLYEKANWGTGYYAPSDLSIEYSDFQ